MFATWLIAWLLGVAVLAGLIAGSWSISTYRQLNQDGAPQPILVSKNAPILDVRSAQEYAIAHIPGSINLYEREVERITQAYPDKATPMCFIATARFVARASGSPNSLSN